VIIFGIRFTQHDAFIMSEDMTELFNDESRHYANLLYVGS
jgi:hypothetical protein